MSSKAEMSLLQSLRWLQTSHEYSDLKIFCGDEVFDVHKAIICPRSQYFATACKWGKDAKGKDEITLADDNPRLIRLMIDYLYQLDYDDSAPNKTLTETVGITKDLGSPPGKNETPLGALGKPQLAALAAILPKSKPQSNNEFGTPATVDGDSTSWATYALPKKDEEEKRDSIFGQRHLKDHGSDFGVHRLTTDTLMYALADKYTIDDLQTLAKTKFDKAAEQDWETQAFIHAAELAFNTTSSSDDGLRSVVVKTLNQHRDLLDYAEVQRLLELGNGMALALVKVVFKEQADKLMKSPLVGFKNRRGASGW